MSNPEFVVGQSVYVYNKIVLLAQAGYVTEYFGGSKVHVQIAGFQPGADNYNREYPVEDVYRHPGQTLRLAGRMYGDAVELMKISISLAEYFHALAACDPSVQSDPPEEVL